MTGRDTGATGKDFGEYLLDTVNDPKVQARWEGLVYA